MTERISPRIDIAFKKIFGVEDTQSTNCTTTIDIEASLCRLLTLLIEQFDLVTIVLFPLGLVTDQSLLHSVLLRPHYGPTLIENHQPSRRWSCIDNSSR